MRHDNLTLPNNRKGSTMKMRARRGDLITLQPDACGYFESEVGCTVTLMSEDLGNRTVRVIKARDQFHHDWPEAPNNLMLVRCEGQQYLVSREHRHLCLVSGS